MTVLAHEAVLPGRCGQLRLQLAAMVKTMGTGCSLASLCRTGGEDQRLMQVEMKGWVLKTSHSSVRKMETHQPGHPFQSADADPLLSCLIFIYVLACVCLGC